jgi:pyrroloquinoline quinone biosynthesis protein B
MQRASAWPLALRQKIYLIHFNHTNPLLVAGSEALREVEDFGFRVCRVGEWVAL